MHLSDARKAFEEFSGKASERSRQLSLAGIAIVWVFRPENSVGIGVPAGLLPPALFFSLSLGSDLLQYLAATVAWGTFHRVNELKRQNPADDPVLLAPRWINWPQTTFFIAKLVFVAVGYVLLLLFVWGLIGTPQPNPPNLKPTAT
jgi:hypothetical protein